MKIMIVGCGGGGCWLAQGLVRFVPAHRELISEIIFMDADKLEERNLDRQLFDFNQIGMVKSVALCQLVDGWLENMGIDDYQESIHREEWFTEGTVLEPNTLVFSCVDNHAGRKAILNSVDRGENCSAIILGNELVEAEAYVYFPSWMDGPLDPRVYYPEILTDQSGDPVRPEGCQGEVQLSTPQLAMANMSAANAALYLFYAWFLTEQDASLLEFMPIRHLTNHWGFKTTNKTQFEKGEK